MPRRVWGDPELEEEMIQLYKIQPSPYPGLSFTIQCSSWFGMPWAWERAIERARSRGRGHCESEREEGEGGEEEEGEGEGEGLTGTVWVRDAVGLFTMKQQSVTASDCKHQAACGKHGH